LAAGFLSIGLVAHVSADQRRISTLPLRVNRAMDAAQARGQLPARDAASPEQKTGTAIIRGRVVAADTGRPLRRARVALSGQNRATSRTATTDLQGRYELRDLPAGRYYVLDSEWRDPDFLTRLREQAVRISLAEGEARNLDLEVVPR
jgi:hypothetical protein